MEKCPESELAARAWDDSATDPRKTLMRQITIVAMAAGLLVVSGCTQPDSSPSQESKSDASLLEGSWTAVALEEGGQEASPAELTGREKRCVFAGNKVKIWHSEGTYKLDPTADPKVIDIEITQGEGKGETLRGLCALEGDTLKICLAQPGKERPRELKTAPKSRSFLVVYQRNVHLGNDSKNDRQKLQGVWEVVSAEREGRGASDDEIQGWNIMFRGDEIAVNLSPEKGESIYKLDTSQEPRTIDVSSDKTVLGIYVVEGDALKYCWQKGGQGRPKDFVTKPDSSGAVMLVLKRSKS